MRKSFFILSFLIASISLYAGHSSMIIDVEAGTPTTLCYGETLELVDLGATISGDVSDGLWFSYGDGVFLPSGQSNGVFSSTTQYQPGLQDKAAGSFTLILVSDDPDGNGPMVEVSDEVTITFMNAPALVCNNSINVSLSEGCEQAVDVTMLLANPTQPYNKYQIELQDENGQAIPNNLLTVDHIGTQVIFEVSHDCSTGFCDGTIEVNDNIAPFLNCIDTEADCEGGTDPESTGFPVPFYATVSSVGDNSYTVTNFDDCSDVTLTYTDTEQTLVCQLTGYVKEITRTWSATDAAGNNSICEQSIMVLPLSLDDVILPENFDGITNSPLTCDGLWIPLDNGYPSTESTGIPAFPACGNIESTYTDIYFEECGVGFKIVRQWFIIDWCMSGSNSINHNQIIKVLDIDGPEFECPEDITIGTNPYDCVNLDYELSFVDEVTDCSSYTGGYKIMTLGSVDVSSLYLSDNMITGLPVGTYNLIYVATDECGNASECSTSLTVEDTSAPFAVCDGFTKVSLGSNGNAELFATSVDDNSYDNCGDFTMEIAKMTDACGWGLDFGPKVQFCCDEIGDSLLVAFKVTDMNGNSNTCMVTVHVEDNLPPIIECPSDLTISCDFAFDEDDLSIFGEILEGNSSSQSIIIEGETIGDYGYFYDNCDASIEESSTINIDCGDGAIVRTFTVTDLYGQSNTCSQTITIENDSPFLESDITWPSNFVMNGCDTIQANSEVTGEPTLSTEKCALVASTYEDQVFYISDGACVKILREWTVIDWCQYDPSSGIGLWTYLQEVKLTNNIAPTFLSCEDQQECTYDDDCESGMITITAYANDDCTDSLELLYLWELDLNDDGSIDEEGEGISFDRELSLGGHRVYWKVEDRCGNQVTCNYMIDVRDCKKPTPYCISSITTTIMPEMGSIDIWAEDFDYGSTDNCTEPSDLIFSFSTNVNDNQRVITCDSIDNGVAQSFTYDMYVTDEWGNQERCSVTFIVQDNSDWCEDGDIKGKIIGKVATQKNKSIPDAEIDIVASIDTFSGFGMTEEDGAFEYGATPELLKYVLRPHYNSGPSDGVSTLDLVKIQRHILGLEEFDNPYDILASDVNYSERVTSADLLTMRKMILGVITAWPNELPNWRFVDSAYVFEDIFDPFSFPDSIVIDQLMDTTHASNFVAVKVGDINGSFNPNLSGNDIYTDLRSVNSIDATLTHEGANTILMVDTDKIVDGLQFSMNIGKATNISSSILSESDYFIEDGILRVSWLNSSSIDIESKEFLVINSLGVDRFENTLAPEIYVEREVNRLNLIMDKGANSLPNELARIIGNPFENDLHISVFNHEEPIHIEVYNFTGKLVFSKNYLNFSDTYIPETFFANTGVYIVKLHQANQEQIEKVIKI